MEAPGELRSAADELDDVVITRREYDEENVLVVDFGPGVEAKLDIVGDVAIVVAGDRQYEFEIPPEAEDITTNDGLLLITEKR